MKFILFFLMLNLQSLIVFANEQQALTLDILLEKNFKPMTDAEISEIILGKKIDLKDLLSQAVYEVEISEKGVMKRKVIKAKSPSTLTSVEYNSRAALLSDAAKMTIKGDKIIITDGVRTYISTLYKKADLIYGVRDIDHEAVSFQVLIQP